MSADPRRAQRPRDLLRAREEAGMSTNLAVLADDLSTLYWQECGADEQIDADLQARTVEAIGKLRDGDWWTIVTELWPYADMGMPQMAALDCVLSWINDSPVLKRG